jgi:Mn-containing catalase
MFHHSSKLQCQDCVDKPDPVFADDLQRAIGGIEGEIRVAVQSFLQARDRDADRAAVIAGGPLRRSVFLSSTWDQ